jgi:hypothetical protein
MVKPAAADVFAAQSMATGPFGVGTRPRAQPRSPGCGSARKVLYPAVSGRPPSTYIDSAGVAPEDQPWARLVPAASPGRPVWAMYSQQPPL